MSKFSKLINPDVHFRVLHLIEEHPKLTQRELAQKLGISLGGVNYCLKALVEIGHIKIINFTKNPSKSAYFYLLTPKGFSEKTRLTSEFIMRKMAEYQAIKREINYIKRKVGSVNKRKFSEI